MSLTVPQLAASVASNQERALQLGNRLYDQLGQSLATHTTAQDELRTRMEGQLNSSLASLNDRAAKLGAKLVKQLNQKQGNAYTYAFPLGITYPTNDALVHGLNTGDMMPAMGLATAPPPLVGATGNDVFVPVQPPLIGAAGNDGFVPVTPPPFNPPGFPPPPVQPPPPPVNPPPPPPVNPPFPPAPPPPGGWNPAPPPPPPVSGPLPPRGTSPGPPPNPVGFPPGPGLTCPPGYTLGSRLGPLPAVPPVLVSGWAIPPGMAGWGQVAGVKTISPWGLPQQKPGDFPSVNVCVSASHLDPPMTGQIRMFQPAGYELWIDPTTGYMTSAAEALPSPWEPMPTVQCDSSEPDPIYFLPGGSVLLTDGTLWCFPNQPPPPPPVNPPCPPGGGDGGGGGGGGGPPPPPLPCGPPVHPPPPAPPGPGGGLPPGQDTCAGFDDYLKAVQAVEFQVGSWIGMAPGGGDPGLGGSTIISALTGGTGPVIPWLLQRFAAWMQTLISNLAKGVPCDPIALTPVLLMQQTLRFVEKYVGVVPDQLKASLDQLSNYTCQYLLPEGAAANRTWLAGQIPLETWECWTKAAGLQVAEWGQVRDAERTRPTVTEARKLCFRNLIDQKTYRKLARNQGVTDDTEFQQMEDAWRPWPAEHELIAWAGEQLFDPATVERFNLDDGFDALYKDQFQKWWEASGRNQDMARKDWQAHWRRPGVGQLIEMVRRLRPGEADPAVVFTDDDLDAALRQEGYNAYWVKRIKAVSHRVAQRRDVQRLYQYHQVDETGMRALLRDQGYDDEFAGQLVESWQAQRKQTESRYNGAPQAAALVRDYAKGLMAKSELQTQVQQITYYAGQDEEIISNAELGRTLEERRLAVSGLKGLFTKGLIKVEDAQAQLAQMGLDADAISELTGYWTRLVKSKPKQVPAATLCTWRTDGLISAAEQFTALTQLGYKGSDATFIVEDCTLKIERAQEKKQQKALAAAQAAAQKAEKAAEKAAANAKRRVKIVTVPGQNGTGAPAAGH